MFVEMRIWRKLDEFLKKSKNFYAEGVMRGIR